MESAISEKDAQVGKDTKFLKILVIILFVCLANIPTMLAQIFISCKNLKNMDDTGRSDPFCEVYLKNDDNCDWVFIGKTEVIPESQNPDWAQAFVIEYFFEKKQQIRFEVYDDDGTRKDEQGKHTCQVGQLIGAPSQTYTAKLASDGSDIIVKTDSVQKSSRYAKMKIEAQDLISMTDKNGMADNPFLIIRRTHAMYKDESLDMVKVFQSDKCSNTTNPKWKIDQLWLQVLCNSDKNMPITFEVWNWSDAGDHVMYGSVQTSVNAIDKKEDKVYQLKDSHHEKAGLLEFRKFKVKKTHSMIDFIKSGWYTSLSVAIDFTGSNGEPYYPNSLHYVDQYNPNALNSYQEAILQIGTILEPYDSNRKFPVFGFGAIPKYMGVYSVTHCFPLNGKTDPEVDGVQGILDAYSNALQGGIELYGPTNFAPCLQTMIDYMKEKEKAETAEYMIMMYVTDGAITDMDDTIDLIVEASEYPMSIIIVGVGNADFSNMKALDCDEGRLKTTGGKEAERDIVQFVEFNKYKGTPGLAESVLKEVPNQFLDYMKKKHIHPAPSE